MIAINEDLIKGYVDKVVVRTVEETLNALPGAETEHLCGAMLYEQSARRRYTRAGHYDRELPTKEGEAAVKEPKLRSPLEGANSERRKRREISGEEALADMYLACVSVRRVEDITKVPWADARARVPSRLNEKVAMQIEEWRQRPISSEHAYVSLDEIWLKRSYGFRSST